jgi:hypothetical protein
VELRECPSEKCWGNNENEMIFQSTAVPHLQNHNIRKSHWRGILVVMARSNALDPVKSSTTKPLSGKTVAKMLPLLQISVASSYSRDVWQVGIKTLSRCKAEFGENVSTTLVRK